MMKKILTFLSMVIFCFSLTAYADNKTNLQAAYISGDYGYNLNADGSATIVWFNKDNLYGHQYPGGSVLYIPNMLDGHPVTKLGNAAFLYNTPRNITTIVVPEGVTTIERSALASEWIAAVYLPSTLTSIDTYAFDGVKTVVCNSANVKIEEGAFYRSKGAVFYGYPSSALEEYVTKTVSDDFQNCVFANIAEAPAVEVAAGTYLVKFAPYSYQTTVNVSSDYAKAGEFIMISVFKEGAASESSIDVLENGVYARGGATKVAVSNYGNGVFGFIMPASSVYVTIK